MRYYHADVDLMTSMPYKDSMIICLPTEQQVARVRIGLTVSPYHQQSDGALQDGRKMVRL